MEIISVKEATTDNKNLNLMFKVPFEGQEENIVDCSDEDWLVVRQRVVDFSFKKQVSAEDNAISSQVPDFEDIIETHIPEGGEVISAMCYKASLEWEEMSPSPREG